MSSTPRAPWSPALAAGCARWGQGRGCLSRVTRPRWYVLDHPKSYPVPGHLPLAGCSLDVSVVWGLLGGWRRERSVQRGSGRGDLHLLSTASGRMSAAQCLEHPWLNNLAEKAKRCNRRLKSQVLLKKYVMRRRWKVRGGCVCASWGLRGLPASACPGGWWLGGAGWLRVSLRCPQLGQKGLETSEPGGRAPQHQGPSVGALEVRTPSSRGPFVVVCPERIPTGRERCQDSAGDGPGASPLLLPTPSPAQRVPGGLPTASPSADSGLALAQSGSPGSTASIHPLPPTEELHRRVRCQPLQEDHQLGLADGFGGLSGGSRGSRGQKGDT